MNGELGAGRFEIGGEAIRLALQERRERSQKVRKITEASSCWNRTELGNRPVPAHQDKALAAILNATEVLFEVLRDVCKSWTGSHGSSAQHGNMISDTA